jgi:uncharacterized membrane protein required for colicin V production
MVVTEMPWGFNWLDAAIAAFVLIFIIAGLTAGLIKSAFTIVGLLTGLFLAAKYYASVGNLIAGYIDMPRFVADTVGFLTIFLATAVIIHTLGHAAAAVTRFQPLKVLDRFGGLAIGLLFGLAICGLILILLAALPIYANFPDQIEKSQLALPIMELTRDLFEQFDNYLPFNLPLTRDKVTEDLTTFSCQFDRQMHHMDG